MTNRASQDSSYRGTPWKKIVDVARTATGLHTAPHIDYALLTAVIVRFSYGSNTFCGTCGDEGFKAVKSGLMTYFKEDWSRALLTFRINFGLDRGQICRFWLAPGWQEVYEDEYADKEVKGYDRLLLCCQLGMCRLSMLEVLRHVGPGAIVDYSQKLMGDERMQIVELQRQMFPFFNSAMSPEHALTCYLESRKVVSPETVSRQVLGLAQLLRQAWEPVFRSGE